MFSSKKYVLAIFVASFVLVACVNCAPEVNIDNLQARVSASWPIVLAFICFVRVTHHFSFRFLFVCK